MCKTWLVPFVLFSHSSLALATQDSSIGAVASAHPLATAAGMKILAKGGNAFDAAVAISATLSVVEPAMSGLGGYGSTLLYNAGSGEVKYLNASGKFPLSTNSDLMRAPTENYLGNRRGAKSISTPGNLNAWSEMHRAYGKLPWETLFGSAIDHAHNGFPIPPFTAKVIESAFSGFSDYSKSIYGRVGSPLLEGDLLVQKDLAKTYELIAAQGPQVFYSGAIAQRIDTQMKASGSFLSIEDLRADAAEWWSPIKIEYKGYEVYTMGMPGNGFSALLTLGAMGQFDLKKAKRDQPEYLHLTAEVLKRSAKTVLATPGTAEERSYIENTLLNKDNFTKIAQSIDANKVAHFDAQTNREGVNTTHFVVVDQWGNIVSSTQTLGTSFGSKTMIEGTGIWMNNSMAFSSFEPKGNPMDVFPGRYKLSSNSPIIIKKGGEPWAALGTPGGHTIPQNIAQVVINLIDFGMTMQEAIDAPKIAFIEEGNFVVTEKDIPGPTVAALRKKGHTVQNDNLESYLGLSGKIGNVMGVRLLNTNKQRVFDVGVDKRRDGWAVIQ
ncbi:gamma-glutamyltransferase family protein [Pseudomonas sp. B28(2017)]|uniref:gamma-glutamyltransferase family protein n=1 Tax=Pseudomonas sp. B28(2017) TaxID=1981730 RepID=UPI000A1EA4B1|nr:gamma-glutamyltransferase family protein [Pseudomonas sp. B28(2017)]